MVKPFWLKDQSQGVRVTKGLHRTKKKTVPTQLPKQQLQLDNLLCNSLRERFFHAFFIVQRRATFSSTCCSVQLFSQELHSKECLFVVFGWTLERPRRRKNSSHLYQPLKSYTQDEKVYLSRNNPDVNGIFGQNMIKAI